MKRKTIEVTLTEAVNGWQVSVDDYGRGEVVRANAATLPEALDFAFREVLAMAGKPGRLTMRKKGISREVKT